MHACRVRQYAEQQLEKFSCMDPIQKWAPMPGDPLLKLKGHSPLRRPLQRLRDAVDPHDSDGLPGILAHMSRAPTNGSTRVAATFLVCVAGDVLYVYF
eukprot:SAG22_NODE_154_length_17189_cov_38.210064_14_plen_98_part_00